MTRPIRSLSSIAVVLGTAAILVAQAPTLNSKPGLWEMTVQIDLPGGMPPGVDTSKMTPQQQAQIAAMMSARGGMKPVAVQSCVTKEDLAKGQVQKDPEGTSCTTKITKQTSTIIEMTQTCTGVGAGTREMHIEATSPESMKVVSKMVTGRGAGTTATITGKWLAAACGNVK